MLDANDSHVDRKECSSPVDVENAEVKCLPPYFPMISRGNPEYERKKRFYYNAILQHYNPRAFVEVETAEDVQAAVKFCKENNYPICVVSGGHSDYGTKNGAFVIKLSAMKRVTVDILNQCASVEAGALLGDVDRATVEHNLATPLGTASIVGFGGQALDLGMGFLSRSFGFLIDNIIDYDLVKADGELVRVCKSSDPELFWAMKGHGSNFGIVTRCTVKLHRIPSMVLGGCCFFAWDDARAVLKHIRDFQQRLQDRKLVASPMLYIGKSRFQVICRLLYVGEVDKGTKVVEDLLSSCPATPLRNAIQPVRYDVFQRSCDQLHENGLYSYQSPGHLLTELTDDYIDEMVDAKSRLTVEENYCTTVYFNVLGGAVKEFPDDSSPFIFREANWWVGAVGSSPSLQGYEKVSHLIEKTVEKLNPLAMPVNEAKLKEIQKRLVEVKRVYDPGNVFCNNPCNIVP